MDNLFNLPASLANEEFFETLVQDQHLRIERIISTGQVTPPDQWYDQAQDEWVVLLQGEAILSDENENQWQLKAGDYLLIKAHQKHRVEFTSVNPPCIWLAIHYSPIKTSSDSVEQLSQEINELKQRVTELEASQARMKVLSVNVQVLEHKINQLSAQNSEINNQPSTQVISSSETVADNEDQYDEPDEILWDFLPD